MARISPKKARDHRYDTEVVEATRKSREVPADWRERTTEEHKENEKSWRNKESAAGPHAGAMIRTNTYNPKLAVAREKIQALRKAKAKRERG